MKNSRFSTKPDHQHSEAGTPVPELCREHGMSSALFYRWRSKYGGMDASMMARMKKLEEENRRLLKSLGTLQETRAITKNRFFWAANHCKH